METLKFVYYKEGHKWVGWLEDYPDYRTQGSTLAELKENLKDIYEDLNKNGLSLHVTGAARSKAWKIA